MTDQDEGAELIELDDGDPLASGLAASESDSAALLAPLAERPEFPLWRRSCSSPDVPAAILDTAFHIAWTNEPFRSLFAHKALSAEFPESVVSILNLYRSYLGDESAAIIERRLRSAETGFSWWGRIEYKVGRRSTVYANMTIVPLFGESAEPLAYSAIINDVSEEYRGLLQRTFLSLLQV